MNVLADAVRRSGSLKRKKVRDALSETAGFKGITGTISFNSFGDPVKSMTINQLRFGGLLSWNRLLLDISFLSFDFVLFCPLESLL